MAVCLHSLLLKSNISLFLSRYTSPFQIYTLCIHPHWLKECTLTLICLACLSCACDEWYLFCSGPWGSHILAAINNVDGMPWPQRGLQSANGEMWSRGQCVFSSVYFQFNPHPSLIPWSQFVWRLLRSQKEWKSQIEGSLWGCFVLDSVLKALLATKRGKRGVFQLSSHSLSQLFLKGGGGNKERPPPCGSLRRTWEYLWEAALGSARICAFRSKDQFYTVVSWHLSKYLHMETQTQAHTHTNTQTRAHTVIELNYKHNEHWCH